MLMLALSLLRKASHLDKLYGLTISFTVSYFSQSHLLFLCCHYSKDRRNRPRRQGRARTIHASILFVLVPTVVGSAIVFAGEVTLSVSMLCSSLISTGI
ncbi:Alcohol oxidase [Fusarium oxysporum f. sp. albedinis]|nr:Alcohol oxidase [Fusarium oxysporum f. sp. albedinis]